MTYTPRLLYSETFAALHTGDYVEYRIPGIAVTPFTKPLRKHFHRQPIY